MASQPSTGLSTNPLLATYPFSGAGDRSPVSSASPTALAAAKAAKEALESTGDTATQGLAEQKAIADSRRIYRINKSIFRTKLVFWNVLKGVAALGILAAGAKLGYIARGIYKEENPIPLPKRLLGCLAYGGYAVLATLFSGRVIYHAGRDVYVNWNLCKYKHPGPLTKKT